MILDNVQFRKNYYQNRNKIRTEDGWLWITVPVNHALKTFISGVTIVSDLRWKKKWINRIYYSYCKTPYFNFYYKELETIILKDWKTLSELNVSLIKMLCQWLDIKTKFIAASEISPKGNANDLILSICKELNADIYLSGISGKEYLRLEEFAKESIKVVFQEFHHPIYKQLYEPFIPCMSVIDLLFNHGNNSPDIINGRGVPVMKEIFV